MRTMHNVLRKVSTQLEGEDGDLRPRTRSGSVDRSRRHSGERPSSAGSMDGECPFSSMSQAPLRRSHRRLSASSRTSSSPNLQSSINEMGARQVVRHRTRSDLASLSSTREGEEATVPSGRASLPANVTGLYPSSADNSLLASRSETPSPLPPLAESRSSTPATSVPPESSSLPTSPSSSSPPWLKWYAGASTVACLILISFEVRRYLA